jgi:hypothetical protein
MANYAVIKDILVVNVIVAESVAIAEQVTELTCVDITNTAVGIGWTYTNNEFQPPVIKEINPLVTEEINPPSTV